MQYELDILVHEDTSIGTLYFGKRELEVKPGTWVHEPYVDGQPLISSISPLSEQRLLPWLIFGASCWRH